MLAFMFSALDEKERTIVIDAMEERKYKYIKTFLNLSNIIKCNYYILFFQYLYNDDDDYYYLLWFTNFCFLILKNTFIIFKYPF